MKGNKTTKCDTDGGLYLRIALEQERAEHFENMYSNLLADYEKLFKKYQKRYEKDFRLAVEKYVKDNIIAVQYMDEE